MIDVTLRLESERSLEQLLAGPIVSRVWLREETPGVYRLNVSTYEGDPRPGAVSAHALLHLLASGGPDEDGLVPPLPALSAKGEELRARWEHLMDGLPKTDVDEPA